MDITASIVSHGHGAELGCLLADLAALREPALRRVIVTLNVPDATRPTDLRRQAWPFDLQWIDNAQPLGFGANHNRAFARDQRLGPSALFAVLNPDLRLRANPFAALLAALQADTRAGLAYPVQRDAAGRLQDHERRWPTPARLLARYLLGRRREVGAGQAPDWVNAAFLLLRRQAYAQVQGFDERYHMYCEDVDLCLRLQGAGWRLARADAAVVEHAGQRASHRRLRHLGWHLASLWRLWRSPAWRTARLAGRGGH
ncbi:MAG: glycosyltransferase [Burkholderiaceae bacterium]